MKGNANGEKKEFLKVFLPIIYSRDILGLCDIFYLYHIKASLFVIEVFWSFTHSEFIIAKILENF